MLNGWKSIVLLGYPLLLCTNVTGIWKTDQIVTLILFHLLTQLIATLVHYTYTVPLPGLVDLSAFLEQVLPTL